MLDFAFPVFFLATVTSSVEIGVGYLGHINALARNIILRNTINKMLDLSILASQYHNTIVKYNEVERNRYVLLWIINCIKLWCFEPPITCHNDRNYLEKLLDILKINQFCWQFRQSCVRAKESNNIFTGTSEKLQNELLDPMLEIWCDKISQEMEDAKFVAIMTNKTTDYQNKSS